MTEFDAILQETLDATIKNMIVFVSVLIILGIPNCNNKLSIFCVRVLSI